MSKRGLSTVVTTLIIILLVLVAVGIVWVVIRNVIEEGAEEISLGKFTIDLKIKEANTNPDTNTIDTKIKRNVGKGDLAGIKFIFNAGGNSESFEQDTNLQELGEGSFIFAQENFNILDFYNIETLSIAPIFKSASGKKVIGKIVHTYKIKRFSTQKCEDLAGECCNSSQTVCSGGTFFLTSNCDNCCVGGTCCEPESVATTCGSWECGTRTNNCGEDVSCGICGTGYHCVDGTCEIISNPCDLTSASWSTSSATDGDTVTLTVTGTGDCSGEAITFDIYEDDPIINDFIISISDTYASTTWTAVWTYVADQYYSGAPENDDDDAGTDPRDYYFEATVDSNGDSVKSGNLEVASATQPCDLTSASWSTTTATEGDTVTLNVQGTNCNGKTISFEVREDDGTGWTIGSDPVTTNPVDVTFGTAGEWTAEWQDDGVGNPEYFFRASVVGESEYVQSSAPSMIVTKAIGTCSEEGGDICTSGEYCPGNILNASDTTECCDTTCQIPTCTSCDTCGDGLFNICDRAECYACTGDSCYFINRILVDECNSCGSTTCESYDNDLTTCNDDPCGLGNCAWDGSACSTITESQVSRSFSSLSVAPGDYVDVTLTVTVLGGETYYAIEEDVPAGWTVTDDDEGATPDPNVLKWVATTGATDTTYVYTVQAPATTGSFDGVYMFEGDTAEITTKGQTTVTVS